MTNAERFQKPMQTIFSVSPKQVEKVNRQDEADYFAFERQEVREDQAKKRSVRRNRQDKQHLRSRDWNSMTENPQMLEEVAGSSGSRRELDFAKDGVGVEVQFGKYAFIAYDFVKFLSFYEEQRINVGVEITAMRSLSREMSSGVGSWESAMQVLKTRPRGHPPMPLAIVGIGL